MKGKLRGGGTVNRVIKILEKGGADKNGMSNFIFSPHLPTQFYFAPRRWAYITILC